MNDLDSASRRIGTTLLGKWTLERLLGEGGMAAVYVGRHKIGRLDAIKILHPAIAAEPQLRARFEQEAHAVNRFKHRGAVEIRDIDTSEDGAPFLVMELLEGETVSALVRRGPVGVETVLRIADETLDVLAAAHACGIIHRDIKPDNLLVQKDGSVKVLDFGIARVRAGAEGKLKTRTGATLGTVAYMPPEQAKGIEIDARADIYAVGATMFRLLAGRRVHEADTEVERLMKVISDPAPPLASAVPHVPADVCAIVDRALAFRCSDRYPDAAAMQADVRALRRNEHPVSARTGSRTDAEPATIAEGRATLAERLPGAPHTIGRPAPAIEPPALPPPAEAPTRAVVPASARPGAVEAPTRAVPGYAHQVQTVAIPQAIAHGEPTATTAALSAQSTRVVQVPSVPASVPGAAASQPVAHSDARRHRIVLAACVAVLVLFAAVGALLLFRSTGASENAGQPNAPPEPSASTEPAASVEITPSPQPTHAGATVAPPPPAPAPSPHVVHLQKHGHN